MYKASILGICLQKKINKAVVLILRCDLFARPTYMQGARTYMRMGMGKKTDLLLLLLAGDGMQVNAYMGAFLFSFVRCVGCLMRCNAM